MKDIVIHVKEDVCATYNRDPEATKLIEIAREFGTVETLDSALSAERAKHQAVLTSLRAVHETKVRELEEKLHAIEEKAVTVEELEVLRALRRKAALEATAYEEALKSRDEQLIAVTVENENRAASIKALFGF